MSKARKSPPRNPRLDQSPDPRAGYPRTPQHEQLEEQLHHEPAASAPAKDAPPPADAPDDAAKEAVDSSEAVTLRYAELRGKLDQRR